MEKEKAYQFFELDQLPEHMRDGMYRWIEHGIKPGGFGVAVLENDLVGAFGRADMTNIRCMKDWANWLYNRAPADCWGSKAAVNKWAAHGGLNGLNKPLEDGKTYDGDDAA